MIPTIAMGAAIVGVNWANWDGSSDGVTTATGGSSVGTNIGIVKISTDKFLAFWITGSSIYVQIITTSGVTISAGSETLIESSAESTSLFCVTLDSGRVLVAYGDATGNTKGRVISISGTSISGIGTEATLASSSAQTTINAQLVFLSTDKVLMAFSRANTGNAVIITTSGTSISGTGSELQFESASMGGIISAAILTSTSAIVGYQVASNTVKALVLSVSGTTVSAGTKAALDVGTAGPNISIAALSSTVAVVSFLKSDGSAGRAVPMSISGTTIVGGNVASFVAANVNYSRTAQGIVVLNNTQCMILYNPLSTGYPYGVVGTITGVNISFGTPVLFNSASTGNSFGGCLVDANRVLPIFIQSSAPYVKVLKQG